MPDRTPTTTVPEVAIGDLVWWYPDGDLSLRPCPAIVTNTGSGLCLNILSGDNLTFRVRDGVPHISDPRCGGEHLREIGGWDLSPQMKRLAALEAVAGF